MSIDENYYYNTRYSREYIYRPPNNETQNAQCKYCCSLRRLFVALRPDLASSGHLRIPIRGSPFTLKQCGMFPISGELMSLFRSGASPNMRLMATCSLTSSSELLPARKKPVCRPSGTASTGSISAQSSARRLWVGMKLFLLFLLGHRHFDLGQRGMLVRPSGRSCHGPSGPFHQWER